MEEKTDYIKLTFRSIKSGPEYYTLDGKDKVLTPIYRKFIKSYDDLNEFEKVYIFSDWLRLTDKLNKIEGIINSF